ncbi:MAG TPA: Crp/Fnr family transcriptional regulator [Sphingobacteriaceae bacterium]
MESGIEVIVNNVTKHISLTPSELDFYTSLFEIRKLKKKEFLFRSGSVCKHEYFVSKGCLRTFTVDKDSVEHTAMFAIEDWFTGDIYSFLTGLPSKNNIMAIEESEVLLLSKKNWEKLLEQVPKFEKLYRIKFQNSFIALEQRMMLSLSDSAEERYLHFIEKYPMFEQRIPQKYIASYLGITPEFLSVIRRKIAGK